MHPQGATAPILLRPRRQRADSGAGHRWKSFPYGQKPHPLSDHSVGKRRKGESEEMEERDEAEKGEESEEE